MADIRGAIRSILAADGTVSGLVGVRIRGVKLAQNETRPVLRLAMLPGTDHWAMGTTPDHTWRAFQVDCYDDDLAGCVTLATAVRAALNGYSGTSESVVIQHIELEPGTDEPFDENTEDFRIVIRGTVKYDA